MGIMRILLALLCCAGWVSCQRPTDGLEARLKQAVDRQLARFVRDLRAELHREIERACQDPPHDLTALLGALDGAPGERPAGVAVAAKPPQISRPTGSDRQTLHDVEPTLRRLDRLSDVPGQGEVVATLTASLRAQVGGLVDTPRIPWHRAGLVVGPVQEPPLRSQFGLPEGAGLVVVAVDEGSPAALAGIDVGSVIVGVEGQAVGLGHPGTLLGAARVAAEGRARCSVAGPGSAQPHDCVLSFPAPAAESAAEALLREMAQKRLRSLDPVPPGRER